jgi:tetratricopeptide (TPR) repeat protein
MRVGAVHVMLHGCTYLYVPTVADIGVWLCGGRTGRWAEAADAFAAVARGLVHTAGRSMDDDSLIEISLKIADCYSMLGEHPVALSGYRWCCETSRAKVGASGPPGTPSDSDKVAEAVAEAENRRALLGMSLHGLAGHLERVGDPAAAIEPLLEALDVARTIPSGRDPRLVDCHARLAAASAAAGQIERAVESATLAADLAKKVGAESSPYIHLANLAVLSGDNPRRQSFLLEALAAARGAENEPAIAHIEALLALS